MRHGRFVSAQAIGEVQGIDLAHALFVKLFAVGSFVEVQIARHGFVRAFTGHHHLDAHRFHLGKACMHEGAT